MGWYEGSKERSKKIGKKSAARAYQPTLEAPLNSDEIVTARIPWSDFRKEYGDQVSVRHRNQTQVGHEIALKHFERIIEPKFLSDVTRESVARYTAARLKKTHRGKKLSVATINKELRSIRAFIRGAVKRRFITSPPDIPFLKEPKRIPTYIDPETFAKLYQHADAATLPEDQGFNCCKVTVMTFCVSKQKWEVAQLLCHPR